MRVLVPAGVAALAALCALPASARPWAAPEGCEIHLTVQARACRVSNHFRCTQDPPGDQWRADFDQDGLFFLSRIDDEAQWVESVSAGGIFGDDLREELLPGAADPASLSELLATGADTYSFDLDRSDGLVSRVEGFDRLTGESVTIDGVTLLQTEFEFTQTDEDGIVIRRARGNEFVSDELRTFFAGPGEADLGDGEWLPIDGSPVRFIFPGDEGFATTEPAYECAALTAEGAIPRPQPAAAR